MLCLPAGLSDCFCLPACLTLLVLLVCPACHHRSPQAYARALSKVGILTTEEAAKIVEGLEQVRLAAGLGYHRGKGIIGVSV